MGGHKRNLFKLFFGRKCSSLGLHSQEKWNPDRLEKMSPKDFEVKSIIANTTQVMTENTDPVSQFIHYLSWTHLKRAVSRIIRSTSIQALYRNPGPEPQ